MAEHAWCRDIPRDEAVRAAEDGRDGPLPTLEEAIASVTNHDAPPGARVSDRQCASPADTGANTEVSRAGQFVPPQAPQPRKCTERGNFAAAAKCSAALSETGEGQSVMRTGRVSLSLQRMGELIEERDAAIRERDAAIRERDEHKEEYYKLRGERITQAIAADRFASAVQEADTLRARVADLEEQLESVADRAAAAETALESAPAASGAAGTEPVAWGIRRSDGTWWESCRATRDAMLSVTTGGGDANNVVSPLYAAPQPAPGWLMAEERGSIWYAIEGLREASSSRNDGHARTFESLLARSSPPEVVLPECPYDGYTMLTAEYVWCECVAVFTAALAAAGVPVKEVGK